MGKSQADGTGQQQALLDAGGHVWMRRKAAQRDSSRMRQQCKAASARSSSATHIYAYTYKKAPLCSRMTATARNRGGKEGDGCGSL